MNMMIIMMIMMMNAKLRYENEYLHEFITSMRLKQSTFTGGCAEFLVGGSMLHGSCSSIHTIADITPC